ncbi:MAG TPA: ParA family protein [Gemmatimonadaceae bacterium]|nr:ParA family protein [Gemmatimonadaceae bacterium]
MGQVLAVVSQKGGVGKTTTAVNLAAAFARRGLKTLLVDVDPQGAVRYGVGLRPGHPTYGMADFLAGEKSLREVILPTALPWLRVILAGTVSNHSDHRVYEELIQETNLLQEMLGTARDRCNVVVVDTPPGLGSSVHRVLEASQHAIIPLQCEPLALQTTPQILRGIQDIAAVNEELTLDGLLLTMYDAENAACVRVAEYVREHLPRNMVFDIVVPRSPASADAFAAGQPVVLRDPADPAAQAYINLATVLTDRLE